MIPVREARPEARRPIIAPSRLYGPAGQSNLPAAQFYITAYRKTALLPPVACRAAPAMLEAAPRPKSGLQQSSPR